MRMCVHIGMPLEAVDINNLDRFNLTLCLLILSAHTYSKLSIPEITWIFEKDDFEKKSVDNKTAWKITKQAKS